MPRLIFKCPHIKSGMNSAAHLKNYVGYIATREGVEKVSASQAGKPATQKQVAMVKQLVREFPLSKGLFEYEDYLAHPTRGNASEFISRAIEDNLDQIAKRENYLQYIAQRPRAERLGSHGLFTGEDDELVLSQVASAVAQHPGTVWLPILSLRREDAQRLGYDSAQRWRELLSTYAPKLAEAMKIPLDQFRWYAAFHNEGHHPHVHMVVYSADGKSGFLTRDGIAKIKGKLVGEIFRQELTEIYQRQTMRRDELTAQSRERMEALLREMESGTLENQRMNQLIVSLAQQLQTVGGRKQYGYLKAPLKALVDEIVDELARDSRVAQAYDLWYEQREEVLRGYRDDLPERLPLSQQKELRQVKNMVIQEAMKINGPRLPKLIQEFDPAEELTALPETDPIPLEDEEPLPNADWTEEYGQARILLRGSEESPPDFGVAYELFQHEAKRGNALAMCDLGRMCMDGLGRDADPEEGQRWYAKTLSALLELEEWEPDRYTEYRIGKLYAGGLGTEQDYGMAARWFTKAAEQGHKYAQYSLAGLYLRGQGVVKDVEKAHQLYESSAAQGFSYAFFQLGKLYRDGIGVEKDMLQAVIWFVQAAERDNSYAAYAMGKLYLEGEEVPKDIEKALRWLYRSAERGNQYAQYQLGKLYLLGREVERNEEAAVEWFTLSAAQGNEYAQWFLDHLHEFSGPTPAQCVIRLLHHVSRIFQEQSQRQAGMRMEVDRKLRQKIREKKIAMGHKADDHEEPVLGYSPR